MKTIRLRELQSVDHSCYLRLVEKARRLCIVVSGYETRCTAWFSASTPSFDLTGERISKVIGFNEMRNVLNRPANDRLYREAGLHIENFPTEKGSAVMEFI